MKVDAIVTTTEHRTVDVRVEEVFDAFWKKITKKFGVPTEAYIDRNGLWETWDDVGHGSGIYDTVRKATEEEMNIVDAFKKLHYIIKED